MTRFLVAGAVAVGVSLGSAAAATTRVTLGELQARRGDTVHVTVGLANPADPVRGMQLTLRPPAGSLVLNGVHAVDRATGLTADAHQQPDGSIRVVLISMGEQTVPPGDGSVLSLDLAVQPGAQGDAIALEPSGVRVAGTDGALLSDTQSGRIRLVGSAQAPGATASGGCALVVGASQWSSSWLALAVLALWRLANRRRVAS